MKRSLLTLLMDASPADIQTAAEAWEVPLTKRTHADNVALLYQAMTDRWTLEDWLDRLPPQARDLAGTLALGPDDGMAREELMMRLSIDPLDLNAALAALRRAAIVHRQSTGVLYLPRELATAIARAIRERQQGELAVPSFKQVLESLDGDVILDAARRWHVPDAPATLRPGDRERLMHALHGRLRTPRALGDVEAALSPGARRVVAALREEESPLSLDDAAALAGAESPAARRGLLAELTSSLLAFHLWAGGERLLVMPAEFRSPALVQIPLPPLNAMSADPVGAWRHPHAFAWDTLTLLRLFEHQSGRWPGGGIGVLAEDQAFVERVAPQFWVAAAGVTPPSAALVFLAAVARARGLLAEREGEGRRMVVVPDPGAVGQAPLRRANTGVVRRLARGRGVDRRTGDGDPTLGGGLARLPYPRARCTRRVPTGALVCPRQPPRPPRRTRPSLLGEEFTAASAMGQTPQDRDGLVRACVEATLRTALTWFGVVTWGRSAMGEAMQLTDMGWWLLGRGREPALPPFGATPLAMQPDLSVLVLNAEPAHLWPLLALAETETLDRVSIYRITATTLRRALRRGLALDQVMRFLESRTGAPLPDATRATLEDWVRAVRRVVIERALLVSADDAEVFEEAVALARTHGAGVQLLADGRALIRVPEGDDALLQGFKEADLTPVIKAQR